MQTTHEILRAGLLKILDANRTRFGLGAATLGIHLRGLSIRAAKEDIIDALDYLAARDTALVEELIPEINRDQRAWRITEAGIRYVDQHNL